MFPLEMQEIAFDFIARGWVACKIPISSCLPSLQMIPPSFCKVAVSQNQLRNHMYFEITSLRFFYLPRHVHIHALCISCKA